MRIQSVWLARFVILVPTFLHNSLYELREIVSPISVSIFLLKKKKITMIIAGKV